jgi:hypothetical protein
MLDFRAEAFTGHWVGPTAADHLMGMHSLKLERDESSGYSRVQTFTLTSESLSSPPTQSPTLPTNPSVTYDNNQSSLITINKPRLPSFIYSTLFLFGLGVLFVCIVVVVVMAFTKRQLKTSDFSNAFTTS